uniref:Uncharacterized protein n=1 Tax=Tetranychus urticae TaxID=32264 RepID=T1K423_TETUR
MYNVVLMKNDLKAFTKQSFECLLIQAYDSSTHKPIAPKNVSGPVAFEETVVKRFSHFSC